MMAGLGHDRPEQRWRLGIASALAFVLLVPTVTALRGADALDVFRYFVLAQTVVVMVIYGISLVQLWRNRDLISDPLIRSYESGRRDRILLVLIVLTDEAIRVVDRLGIHHLSPRSPFVMAVLWLALSAAIKSDVRRWQAVP